MTNLLIESPETLQILNTKFCATWCLAALAVLLLAIHH